jgi:glutaminyl-peptide cyclotransferase
MERHKPFLKYLTISKIFQFSTLLFVIVMAAACGTSVTPDDVPPTPVPQISPLPTTTVEPLPEPSPTPVGFNAERAFADVEYQVSLGPRLPGSEAHAHAVEWMVAELEAYGWQTEVQEAEMLGHPIRNVIGKRGSGSQWIVLGAHYDSRFWADEDPDPANHFEPVPGANDGASGVAVLLELARVLPDELDKEVWLVFFDAEDQGRIPEWDWILGSRAFVDSLETLPDIALVIDMIGDADLNIYKERNSDPEITKQLWSIAADLGYAEQFIPEYKYTMLDDHIPFIERGIPSVLIIDFDYPYWHTLEDTPDKVSPQSLRAVGETVLEWLLVY